MDPDPKDRAARLDEGLEIITGLWKGKSFHYEGQHFQVQKVTFRPTPVQKPRIPIWVGGFWPHPAPFKRAARWDGILPLGTKGWLQPDDVREILSFVCQYRTIKDPIDFALINNWWIPMKKGEQGINKVERYEEAGVNWWLQALYKEHNSMEELKREIRAGTPKR
jgi:hypothetical protein